jgi:CRP-like cAMP-binding protein
MEFSFRQAVLRQVASRIACFGGLSPQDVSAIVDLQGAALSHTRGTDITAQIFEGPHVVLSGWACHMRPVEQRRRQIFGFIVPGDIIGSFWRNPHFAFCQSVALTRLELLPAASLLSTRCDGSLEHPALVAAARKAEDHAQHLVFDHMVRLEKRDAYAGLVSLLLEIHERLRRVGLVIDETFQLPIGQRVLAQALGLSVAHTNFTLQRMAADGLFEARGNAIRLLQRRKMSDLAGLAEDAGPYAPGAFPAPLKVSESPTTDSRPQ